MLWLISLCVLFITARLVAADRPLREWSIKCFGPPPAGSPSGLTLQKICAKAEYNDRGWLQNIRDGNTRFEGLGGYCFPRYGVDAVRPYLLPVSFETPPSLAYGKFPIRLSHLCRDRCWCDSWYQLAGMDPSMNVDRQPMSFSANAIVKKATGPLLSHVLDIDDDHYESLEELRAGDRYSQIVMGNQLEEQIDASQRPQKQIISLRKSNMIECSKSSLDQPIDMRSISDTLGIPPPYSSFSWRSVRKLCATALSGGHPAANAGMYCRENQPLPDDSDYQRREISFSDDMTPRAEWTMSQNYEFSIRVRAFCFESCWCQGHGQAQSITQSRNILQNGWKLTPKVTVTKSVDKDGKTKLNIQSTKSPMKSFFGRFSPNPTARQCQFSPDSKSCPTEGLCFRDGEDICTSKPWPVEELGPIPDTRTQSIINVEMTCGQVCEGPAARYCGASSRNGDDCKCVYLTSALRQYLGEAASVSLSTAEVGSHVVAFCLSLGYLKNERVPRLLGIGGRDLTSNKLTLQDIRCMCNGTYASVGCCNSDDGLVWEAKGLRL